MTIKKTTEELIEIPVPSYWKYGPHFAYVSAEDKVLIVCTYYGGSSIETRRSLTGNDYTPCTHDEFVAAYVYAINAITEASGIEHLTLEGGAYAE